MMGEDIKSRLSVSSLLTAQITTISFCIDMVLLSLLAMSFLFANVHVRTAGARTV
jgi:hypothetical protein